MARMIDEDDAEDENIVYDSQGEEDVWPDSQASGEDGQNQSSVGGSRGTDVRVYGKLRTTYTKSFNEKVDLKECDTTDSTIPSYSPLTTSQRQTSKPTEGRHGDTLNEPISPSKISQSRATEAHNPNPGDENDPIHFDSSDDDIPLPQNNKYRHAPTVSVVDPAEQQDSTTPAPNPGDAPSPPRRALRARKPEQQMPYTLDLMRHRDQFRRRGLKPVQNPDNVQPLHKGDDEDDQYQSEEENQPEIDKDERYVSPNRRDGQPPVKKRRVETLKDKVEKIQSRHVRRFVSPDSMFSKSAPKVPKPPKVAPRVIQQTTPERDVFDFNSESDEDIPILPVPESPKANDGVFSPPQIVTPISNNRESSPLPYPPLHLPIAISSDDEESEETLQPPPRISRISIPTDSSASSSESDVEEIEVFKRKARGVLPGSFFTVRASQSSSKATNQRHNPAHDNDRRGVAKTKVKPPRAKPSRFEYIASSDDEDEEESPHEKKKNFIDLTREEKIQDDIEGWDIEEDLIDRMMNWGGNSGGISRKRSIGSKKKSDRNMTKPKRKRQRRINEFTISTNKAPRTLARKGAALSIVDACDVYTSHNTRSPPSFMKIARRQSREVKDFGRRKPPNRKRFSFAEEEDQDDVNTVIDEWENGTIAQRLEKRTWTKPAPQKRKQTRLPFMGRQVKQGARKTRINLTPLAPIAEENLPPAEPKQPTINKFIRPGAPRLALVGSDASRGRVERNIKIYSTGQIESTVRGRAIPNVIPPPLNRHPNDIATWLRSTSKNNSEIVGEEHQDFTDITVDPEEPLPLPRPKARRKPQRVVRRNVTRMNRRLSHVVPDKDTRPQHNNQLSLDDIWFSNDSTSFTYGVPLLPERVFLDNSTFIGRRLLRKVLDTKPAVEDEIRLWETRVAENTLGVETACERLAGEIDQILDALEASRLVDGSSLRRIHDQVLTFADFLVSYLNGLTAVHMTDIQHFGSKQLRLTELALDRLDGTILHGDLDLNDPLTLVGLSILQVLTAACHQLCVLTSHNVTILGADQVMSRLSRRLLQCLLSGGFEPVQQVVRSARAKSTRDDDFECDSIILDIWSTFYQLFQSQPGSSQPYIRGFWDLLQSELEIEGTSDARVLDRAWLTILNISAITTLDPTGVAHSPSKRPKTDASGGIWNIVEKIVVPFLQSYSTVQHHRYDSYIRTLFGRCYTLISTWRWSHGAKTLLTVIYSFYTERRFDNLKTEAFGIFPKFFISEEPLEISSTDTTFMIFLKLTISYIKQQHASLRELSSTLSRRQRLAAARDLDRFVNRITPLRTYQTTFSPLDYIALQNHYRLLLTLYWVAPEGSRPSVERIRDVIDIVRAPNPAQVICMETWSLLSQIQLRRGEDISSSTKWVLVMFRHMLNEYMALTKSKNTSDIDTSDIQIKSKIRASESIILKALQSMVEVIPLAKEAAAPLVGDVGLPVLKVSDKLPVTVVRNLLHMLQTFWDSLPKRDEHHITIVPIPVDQDSQEYGDASFVEEFLAAQEKPAFPAGIVISDICSQLYQVIANSFAKTREKNENLELTINIWISGLAVLCQHRQYDWATFLQYGGEWERLRSIETPNSRVWCPYILTRVLLADSNAYFQGRDHFISAWFEGIVEPTLAKQHALTSLLLNIDDRESVLENSIFVRNEARKYDISSEELFEARPALITHALANMGRQFDKLAQHGENAPLSICKQTYLDYLHRLLSSMKAIYLELKDTDSEDLVQYISLAQHVTGNIIQYCASFVKEVDRTFRDLPVLDYFTNGETFPQPGSNEIAYAAQRLRGVARKDGRIPFSNGTQSDIFWSIKSFLERSVRNNQIGDFVEFCVLAMCEEDDESIAQHVRLLRSFVMRDIFCEYLKVARETPEINNRVWNYVIPCLRAAREVYSCVWETMIAENTAALNNLVSDMVTLMLGVYAVLDIIYDPCNMDVGPYLSVCCRIFDFVVLVDHIAFYLTGIPGVCGINDLGRVLRIVKDIGKGMTMCDEDIDWIEIQIRQTMHSGYIRATVKREMAQNIQLHMDNIAKGKLEEILGKLNGEFVTNCFDEFADLYI